MSDPIDAAMELEIMQRDLALRAHKAGADISGPIREHKGKRICSDCLERLSVKRLRAAPNSGRCVECQEIHEKQKRVYR